MLGLLAYMINPDWMAWSSMRLPVWVRWLGVGIGIVAGSLLVAQREKRIVYWRGSVIRIAVT